MKNRLWRRQAQPEAVLHCSPRNLVQFFFLMGQDGAVRSGIGNAGQNITCFDLIIIQEGLVRLVYRPLFHLASAGGASPSAAGIGQVDALLFSSIQNINVVSNLNRSVQTLRLVAMQQSSQF